MKNIIASLVLFFSAIYPVWAQTGSYIVGIEIVGLDTLPAMTFDTVTVVSIKIGNKTAQAEYQSLKRRVVKMEPYATKAVMLLRQVEDSIAQMDKKRNQKQYINGVLDELNDLFFKEMKDKFSRKDGMVMMKMVERQTGEPLYNTIKRMKNPIYAITMQTVVKQYGYDLKKPYDPENDAFDRDLEEILQFMEKNGGIKSLDRNAPTPPPKSFATYDSLPAINKFVKQRSKDKKNQPK
jgi:DNA-binding phage protein